MNYVILNLIQNHIQRIVNMKASFEAFQELVVNQMVLLIISP